MSTAFRIRLATAADAPLLARFRVAMFVDMGVLAPGSDLAATIAQATERLLERAIPAGEWTAWIAEDDGGPLGSGAALLQSAPPGPACPSGGTLAYLLNFSTRPEARGRGVATSLVRTALAWCREQRVVRITLHASAAGRRVYERVGFVPRPGEMIWSEEAAAALGEAPSDRARQTE
jgi:GNAT superfamily N-acetyltransferase